jgi:hypothetical protein
VNKIEFTSKDAMELWHNEIFENYDLVEQVFVDTWRWGNNYDIIITDNLTGRLFSAFIKVQEGDNYYVSWEDAKTVTFYEVERVEKITYTYKRIK